MNKRATVLSIGLLALALVPSWVSADVVVTLSAVDPSTQRVIDGALSYRGPCPITIKFVGRIESSAAGEIQYRIVRSDNAITPVKSITVQAGASQAVETTWTIAGNTSGWMEVEVLFPQVLRSNRVPFTVECAAVAQAPAQAQRARAATATAPVPQKAQSTSPARPAGKAIPKAASPSRPAGKALAVPAVRDPGRATYFVANDQTGNVTIFDAMGNHVRTFQAQYTKEDGFGVGDVDGDGLDEIVIAGDVRGLIRIFEQNGEKAGEFDGNFSRNDGFAVGDVNGDGKSEILRAGDQSGIIEIFASTGQKLRSFDIRFTNNDALDVGDVNGDGVDDILHHGDRHGRVTVFNFQGGIIAAFDTGAQSQLRRPRDSGIGAGDINGDGISEIMIGFDAGDDHNILKTEFINRGIGIYDRQGKWQRQFRREFTMGDTLKVGDVTGDGIAELVVAGDVHRSVYVHDKDGGQIMTFIAGYTKNDGFAIARVRRR